MIGQGTLPSSRLPIWLQRGIEFGVRHAISLTLVAILLVLLAMALHLGWRNLFATPDQRGRWLMGKGDFAAAADAFVDPMWRGIALMRAGDFKAAAEQFGGLDNAVAAYDAGNALVMLGKYEDAVGRYDRALALRPGWPDAEANRTLARLRAERLKTTGGDSGVQEKPDEVVYDKDKKPGPDAGKEQVEGGAPMSDEAIRALWLKRVHTQPADFLRAKFVFQLQTPPAAAATPAPARP